MSSDLSPLFLYHLSITLDFYSLFGSLSNYFELFQISPCFFTHSFYVIVTLSLHLLISLSPYYSFILILCQTISWLFPLDHSLSLSFHHATSICLFFFHLSYVTLSLYYTPFLPLCHEDNNEEIVWIKPILHYENSIHLIYIYLIVTCNFVHTSLMRLFFPAPLILFTSLYFFYLIFISVSFFPDAIPFTRYSHSLLFSLVFILPSLPHILSFSLSYEMYLWFLSPNDLTVNISINESPSQKLLFLHYLFLTLFLCLLFYSTVCDRVILLSLSLHSSLSLSQFRYVLLRSCFHNVPRYLLLSLATPCSFSALLSYRHFFTNLSLFLSSHHSSLSLHYSLLCLLFILSLTDFLHLSLSVPLSPSLSLFLFYFLRHLSFYQYLSLYISILTSCPAVNMHPFRIISPSLWLPLPISLPLYLYSSFYLYPSLYQ